MAETARAGTGDSRARPNPSPKTWSLRGRLVAVVLLAALGVFAATGAYVYARARHEIGGLLDAHLAQSASLIVAQSGHDLDEIEVEHAPELHERARRVAFQIWEGGNLLRLHSAGAPSVRLAMQEQGFSDTVVEGRPWRVFSTWDDARRNLVQVGERADARREIVAAAAWGVVGALAFALPVLAAIVWLVIGGVVAPLRALGFAVASRRSVDLAPLDPGGAPREVLPLVESLNDLFARVARLIDNERRFTADAAHELRTPLAALRTQAEVARNARNDAERDHALAQIVAAADRAARLTDQLLTLARLEPAAAAGIDWQPVNLRVLAREVVAQLAPTALAQGVEVEVGEGEPVVVDAAPELLAILLRNLVDNAVRHGGRGGAVQVDVAMIEREAVISVTDAGPGIAAEERTKVGRRFYRVLGTSATGSGLGLSIVQRVAEIHGGSVVLEPGPGGRGLRVRVRLVACPAPASATSPPAPPAP